MKAMIVITILFTLGAIAISFYRHHNWKKLLISLATFAVILTLAGLGAMVRSVVPLFIAHLVLVVIAWGGLLFYIARGKLYWQLILSPSITIILFIIMERLIGSAGAGGS